MNYLRSNGRVQLWNRFQRWRMRRISSRIQRLNLRALALFAKLQRIRDRLDGKR